VVCQKTVDFSAKREHYLQSFAQPESVGLQKYFFQQKEVEMDPYGMLTQFLFSKNFGDTRTVAQYRRGIEPIPESLVQDDRDLSLLSLADPRPGLLRCCRLLRIKYEKLGCADGDVGPFDDRFVLPTAPFWFRHDGGMENRKRRPDHCRDEATGLVLVGTAMEGLFVYAHHPHIVVEGEHVLDLPGTVHHSERVYCAYLGVWSSQTRLHLYRHSDLANPRYGTLRVRRK